MSRSTTTIGGQVRSEAGGAAQVSEIVRYMDLCACNELFQDACSKFMVIASQVEENAERLAAAQNWWARSTLAQKQSPEGGVFWQEILDFTTYKETAKGPGFSAYQEVWLQHIEPYQRALERFGEEITIPSDYELSLIHI